MLGYLSRAALVAAFGVAAATATAQTAGASALSTTV